MKVDLETGGSSIYRAMENLQVAWLQVTESWDDSVSKNFQERYLETLIPEVKKSLDSINRMQLLLKQASKECE